MICSNYHWMEWNGLYTTTSSAITTSCVWQGWNEGVTFAVTANSCGYVWQVWNHEVTSSEIVYAWPEWNRTYTPQEAEAIAAQVRAEQARLAEHYKKQAEKRELAGMRARALLVGNLDEAQAKDYEKSKLFLVHSRDRKRTYRITYGTSGNVELLNPAGRVVASFCIHPHEFLPTEDVMLAQKLMLEAAEEEFLRIANRRDVAA